MIIAAVPQCGSESCHSLKIKTNWFAKSSLSFVRPSARVRVTFLRCFRSSFCLFLLFYFSRSLDSLVFAPNKMNWIWKQLRHRLILIPGDSGGAEIDRKKETDIKIGKQKKRVWKRACDRRLSRNLKFYIELFNEILSLRNSEFYEYSVTLD